MYRLRLLVQRTTTLWINSVSKAKLAGSQLFPRERFTLPFLFSVESYMNTVSPKMALWLLIFVSFVWGIEFVLVDLAIEQIPTHTFNFLRFLLAGLALLPLYYFSKERKQSIEFKKVVKPSLILGFLLFLGFFAQTEGMHYTSVSNAGFITGLNVPLVSLLGYLIFRNRTSLPAWAGITAATAGLFLLTMGDKMEFNGGDLLVLVCAFSFALHIIFTGRWVSNLPVITLSIIQLFAVAAYSLIAGLLSGDPLFYHADADPISAWDQLMNPINLGAILIAGILGSGLALWAQGASQQVLSAPKVALIFASEPVFAHVSAWLILDEQLGPLGFMGAGLIIAGMLISELGDKKHPPEVMPLDHTAAPK